MVRIAGIDLPRTKRIEYALTKIFGIGIVSAQEILEKANIDPNIRTNDLTDENVSKIREVGVIFKVTMHGETVTDIIFCGVGWENEAQHRSCGGFS